jgi:hypothetical protein
LLNVGLQSHRQRKESRGTPEKPRNRSRNWRVDSGAASHLFEKVRVNGSITYKKYDNINTVKKKILALATNQKKLREHVTIRNPRASQHIVKIKLQTLTKDLQIRVTQITIDDIDNVSRVRPPASKVPEELHPPRLPETQFKMGTARILGNRGTFKDWGGEKNDLYTSNVKIKGKRYAAAFGFKGPGKSGKLTPGKMGKTGDQIQSLFSSTARVLIVQYEGEIAESVVEQMQKLAISKSIEENQQIFYCVIALEDS